jgi:hypothetical protein
MQKEGRGAEVYVINFKRIHVELKIRYGIRNAWRPSRKEEYNWKAFFKRVQEKLTFL